MIQNFDRKDAFLTVKQAASVLNLSVPTIKNYIYSGKLKSVKTPGGHHRIRMSDLSASVGINLQEFVLNKPVLEVISGLINVIERREAFNQGHAESVARSSLDVAEELQFSDSQKKDLQLAALLHDIGKVNIEERILNKSTSLTGEEFSTIKKHPEMGEGIVQSIAPLKRLSLIIRQHHERFDGEGYPDSLPGRDIQKEARIIAVAEAFDVMTQQKPYRKAIPQEAAFAELKRGANTQFDPEIVEIFLKLQKKRSG
ncbi:MAG: HD domain-containing protein [Candidatus Ratteibacteria bacterium]|nr:HD domain-containing protein [Candidatus Ratteibacteria bacterium]